MSQTTQTASPTRVALKFGLMLGVAYIIFDYAILFTKLKGNTLIETLGSVIAIAGMVYAMVEFRKLNQGWMTFGQGFGLGTLVWTLAGLIFGISQIIYFSVYPQKLQEIKTMAIETYEKMGYTDEQIELLTPALNLISTSGGIFLINMLAWVVGGVIIALIAAAFLFKKKPVFEDE